MDYIKLGHCGLQVSRLCLGTMNMGSKQWKPWVFDKAESTPLIKTCSRLWDKFYRFG